MTTQSQPHRWPEGAIVYQIYPRSFKDSNGDGVGDIPGIVEKLDYLKDLGVNAVWLSPFYPSPMADFGYDVADYCDVDPIFGELADMERLLAEAHERNIKIMIDLVPNHSSDTHEWFQQSRQSREGKYADWYVWRDAKGHDKSGNPLPPNNWVNVFSGSSAWEWEPARQQFYLHSFHAGQPDLNWGNPKVREAIKDAMRFWLDRGVDGFRVDAVPFMAKDPEFADDPKNPHYKKGDNPYGALDHVNSTGWPAVHAYLNEIASVLKEPAYQQSERFMVTEGYPRTADTIREYLAYYEGMDPQVAAPFNFEGLGLPWDAKPWAKFLSAFHSSLDSFSPLCVPSYAFGNHDQWRIVTRLGEDAARSAAVLLLTLPGMSFIYNGDEIGMKNGVIPAEFVQDPGAAGGDGRDPERTPMQWGPGKNADFTTADMPWLPVGDNYKTHNVATELTDPASFLMLYRQLGKLRNTSQALRYGSFKIINIKGNDVLGYTRTLGDETLTVFINFSKAVVVIDMSDAAKLGKAMITSDPSTKLPDTEGTTLRLRPHEAVIFA